MDGNGTFSDVSLNVVHSDPLTGTLSVFFGNKNLSKCLPVSHSPSTSPVGFSNRFSPAYKADVTGSNVVSIHVGVAGSPAAAGSTRATHSAPLVRSSGLTATTVVGARGQRGLCSAGLAYAAAKATRALSIASPASLPRSIRASAGVTWVGLGLAPWLTRLDRSPLRLEGSGQRTLGVVDCGALPGSTLLR